MKRTMPFEIERVRPRRRLAMMLIIAGVVSAFATAALFAVRAQSAAAKPEPTPAPTARGEVSIDPRRQQLMGVRTVPVVRRAMEQPVRAVGSVRYDETRQSDVNVKVEGWIRDLYVDYTGQPIAAGQPLFTLYSPDVLTTQQEYLLAVKTRGRDDALAAAARQRLLRWDVAVDDMKSEAIVFRAPVSGFVIEKQAVKGLHVMPGQSLYKVVDLSNVWIEADIRESELASVRAGDRAMVTLDAYPGERFSGRVIYIYPYLDESTRTNKVRLSLANRGGRLKPGMFANVELTTRGAGAGGTALLIPTDALLDSGVEQLVFVARGDGVFEPRTVKAGRRLDGAVQILDGLTEGDRVAAGAAFFLDSESSLRAVTPGPSVESPAPAPQTFDIALRVTPDPPASGADTQFEVTLKDAAGKPIALTGADVSIQLFMPAMPTMNMPAMRNEVKLSAAGDGVYRGTGTVMMAGRWDVTISVTRAGTRIGQKKLALTAR